MARTLNNSETLSETSLKKEEVLVLIIGAGVICLGLIGYLFFDKNFGSDSLFVTGFFLLGIGILINTSISLLYRIVLAAISIFYSLWLYEVISENAISSFFSYS